MGYWESDFVGGIGDTAYNTQVTSNSLIFRIRQYYVTMRKNKFEFQAGQSWSMMTPNRIGISPLPADLFYGQQVDVNYLNGLTWAASRAYVLCLAPSEREGNLGSFDRELCSILRWIGWRKRGLFFRRLLILVDRRMNSTRT